MQRRFPTLALTTLGVAAGVIGLTAGPAFAANTEDPRATAFDGNAKTCAADSGQPGGDNVDFPGTFEFPEDDSVNSDASNGIISGDVHDPEPDQFPGFNADDNSLLDVTVADGFVIDAIIVKAGNAYNVYGSEDAPFTDLRGPLVGAQQVNIPTISHWFACYHEADPEPEPETVDVTLDKVTAGGTAPAGASYTFTVDCESGTETTPAVITTADDPLLVADEVTEGDSCTITETGANGAQSTSFQVTGGTVDSTTANSVTFTVADTDVSVVATNTFPEPNVIVAPAENPPAVQPNVVIPATPQDPQVAAGVLARTGSPADHWYVLAGIALVTGGLLLYGSTARRIVGLGSR